MASQPSRQLLLQSLQILEAREQVQAVHPYHLTEVEHNIVVIIIRNANNPVGSLEFLPIIDLSNSVRQTGTARKP